MISKKSRLNEEVLSYSFIFMKRFTYHKLIKEFVNEVLIHKTNPKVFRYLKKYSSNKFCLISTNAFQDIIIEFLNLNNLSIPCVGSSIHQSKKYILGGYKKHILKYGKLRSLQEKFKDLNIDEFWTDDIISDSDLVKHSTLTILVTGGNFEKL